MVSRSLAFLTAVAAASLGLATLGTTPASAGCHLIDCVENVYLSPKDVATHSCESLWILRNSIYDDAGYCFSSARGMKWFINDGCTIADQEAVPLNDDQRANIDVLKAAEAGKGC